MKLNSYVAWVRHGQSGTTFRVVVQAEHLLAARMMVEMQFGAANIVHWPVQM